MGKGLKVFLAILVCLIAACVVVYFVKPDLFKFGKEKEEEVSETLKTEISEKVSLVLSKGESSSEQDRDTAYLGYGVDSLKYDDTAKLQTALAAAKKRYMTSEDAAKLSSLIKEKYGDVNLVGNYYVIDAKDVATMYKTIFGGEVKHASIDGLNTCPIYRYDSNASMYIVDNACGRGLAPIILFAKENYKLVNDKVVVTVKVGTYEYETGKLYKGVGVNGNLISKPTIENADDLKSLINTNKNSFETYKLTFAKDGDTYVFDNIVKA